MNRILTFKQMKMVTENFEEEKMKWKEEYKKLEDHYVAILADKEVFIFFLFLSFNYNFNVYYLYIY